MLMQPLRNNASRKAVAQGRSIPFPVEGLDTVSPLSDMSPKRALILDNIIPRQSYGELRRGWSYFCDTGGIGHVDTLMAYHSADGTSDRLFAAAEHTTGSYSIYDATNAVVASGVTGLSNARFQHVQFTTTGGHFLYAVNGADDPQIWNGTAWSNPTITGATASQFIGINSFKNRLFFCNTEKLGFYYLPVDSIQGAASYFQLGAVMNLGGYLVAMGTWTIDGGVGVDDHAVFVSSRGQVAVYKGSNPGDANDWALVGVYNLPMPIGRRCLTKVGGDLYIITVSGIIPMSRSLAVDKAAISDTAITRNIAPNITSASDLYNNNYGWQLIGYPKQSIAVLNIPISEGVIAYQYVMNTLSGAWCRFTGLNACCWELFGDDLYFGAAEGIVCKADSGASDGGEIITADVKTAFNYFGQRGSMKRFTMLRALITSDASATPQISVNTDFRDAEPTGEATVNYSGGLYWNQFNWDAASWPAGETSRSPWQSVSGIGYCAAVRLRFVASVQGVGNIWNVATWDQSTWDSSNSLPVVMKVNGFDLLMEKGGFI